jgi:hypothetical protein
MVLVEFEEAVSEPPASHDDLLTRQVCQDRADPRV